MLKKFYTDRGIEMNEFETVEYYCHESIGYIYFNRPDRLNAVIPTLVQEVHKAFKEAENDGVRAVILAGRGKAFCSGHDLKSNDIPQDDIQKRNYLQQIQDITKIIRSSSYPVIADIHGYALGAGLEFALCCDLVVANVGTVLGFPEVSVGLSVTGGISHILPNTIGMVKAKELLLLGEKFTAQEAQELGLINFVSKEEENDGLAVKLADKIVQLPRESLSRAKFVLNNSSQTSINQAYELEIEHAIATLSLQKNN